jgi:hypothetical protein
MSVMALPAAAESKPPAGEVEASAAALRHREGFMLPPDVLPALETLDDERAAMAAAAVALGWPPLYLLAAEVAAARWQCVARLGKLRERAAAISSRAADFARQAAALEADLAKVDERAAAIAGREQEAAERRQARQAEVDRLINDDARISAVEAARAKLVSLDAASWEFRQHAERLATERQNLTGRASRLAGDARSAVSATEGTAADVLAAVYDETRLDPDGARALDRQREAILDTLERVRDGLLDEVVPALEALAAGIQSEPTS